MRHSAMPRKPRHALNAQVEITNANSQRKPTEGCLRSSKDMGSVAVTRTDWFIQTSAGPPKPDRGIDPNEYSATDENFQQRRHSN